MSCDNVAYVSCKFNEKVFELEIKALKVFNLFNEVLGDRKHTFVIFLGFEI